MKIYGLPSGGFNYDNLDIIPVIPAIKPSDINISVRLTPNIVLSLPIISSPMDTVTDSNMAIVLGQLGGLGILHNNYSSITAQADEINKVKQTKSVSDKATQDTKGYLQVGAVIPNVSSFRSQIRFLVNTGVDILALDSLHSDPHEEKNTIKYIKDNFPHIEIMSGNIVHEKEIGLMIKAGVSCIRVGISAGSINRTRFLTGIGRTQGRSVFECAKEAKKYGISIIADGGIKNTGDISIALALGACTVMLGGLLSTTKESPGVVKVDSDGRKIKIYRGMSTKEVINSRIDKGKYGDFEEGLESEIELTTTVPELVKSVRQSLSLALYRTNSDSIPSFHKNVELEYHH